jgi:UDP-sugar transporter A1/2/3
MKLLLSIFFLAYECKTVRCASALMQEHLLDIGAWLRTSLPCLLYTLQNNLLFIALSNLPGAEYQVTYQLKILTTATLSMLVLGKVLSPLKWFSLLVLTCGVALIELRPDERKHLHGNRLVGIGAVLIACFTSALAGVLMEKLMKRKGVSMWITNIQVASVSTVVSLIATVLKDSDAIRSHGFFQGYYYLVWIVVSLQAVGGLVIASVMKYADNILKCFGNALAISFGCLISGAVLQEFSPNSNFIIGTGFVLASIFVYGMPDNALGKNNTSCSGLLSWRTEHLQKCS